MTRKVFGDNHHTNATGRDDANLVKPGKGSWWFQGRSSTDILMIVMVWVCHVPRLPLTLSVKCLYCGIVKWLVLYKRAHVLHFCVQFNSDPDTVFWDWLSVEEWPLRKNENPAPVCCVSNSTNVGLLCAETATCSPRLATCPLVG